MRRILACDSNDLRQAHPLGGLDETFRLDAGKAHQILDDPQHAPGFIVDRAAKTLTQRVSQRRLVGQRFRIADDGRQGCAELVTGVGHEVDPHLLGGAGGGAIDQADQQKASVQRPDLKIPAAIETTDPGDLHVRLAPGQDGGERLRLAEGETDIPACDPAAQQAPGRSVGCQRLTILDQKGGVLQRIEQGGD